MGGVSSKAARNRKLPSGKPSWTSSRNVPGAAATEPECLRSELAFERDAKDTHFMEKLGQLGPVRVDHLQTTSRATRIAEVQHMYQSRVRSEVEAASLGSTKNRLLATSLTELLEMRKSVTNGAELEALAQRYDIDTAKLERLCRVVSVPSVENTILRAADMHGEESLTMACWVDPVYPHV